jgi:hypothetical protein
MNPMGISLVLVLAIFVIALIVVQVRKDTYDLRYLIIDPDTKQPSIYKIGQLTALLVSTWGFVNLTMSDKLTEFYFTGYMAIWAGTNVANTVAQKYFQSKIDKDANKPD